MDRFSLVNPLITGSLKTSTSAKTPLKAAKKLYSNLSQYFTNSLPSWFFSIQDSHGKMFHFEVSERPGKDAVNFTIRGVGMKEEGESRLRDVISQNGGKKHDDSSSSSSSSDDRYLRRLNRYRNDLFEQYLYLSMYYVIDGDWPVKRISVPNFVTTVNAYPVMLLPGNW